ncbi:glycogen debranching enzyme GlgX [Pleurocapsa sp. PCC 7327]|uniref:glycogen debranching protein GlgX n=1 Tax=Pleurocapsa sp. PCC 7327 TaxID=118163 RepID=UPI00029FEC6F|nr:glycogen debranching protein GlgX [Pleurocapsa sp. PCC 7327]AFY76141.1 glycogen debranching enzyme GlgX [Pleurocapsa sp. PCC 7327]
MTGYVLPGKSFPIGATVYADGVNFCIFSKHATRIELLLFDEPNDPKPARVIALDSKRNRTFHYWHVFVRGIGAGQIYAYRAYGPFEPENGHRFDGNKVLLDPYARAIAGEEIYDRQAAINKGDNCDRALRGVVFDPSTYDWEGDRPLRHPYANTVIYEMHVGGFTRHPNSSVAPEKRGTFAGLIEKIPYLKDLGITAVELLPIHYFDVEDAPPGHDNYWGYSTIAFFAPHRGYSSRRDPLGSIDEFRDMVKALHRAGIEVILDVVFNHTAEGNQEGPTLSFRGLDNSIYYILEEDNLAEYSNYSGCGNTFKANHPIAGELILDCLRYWVAEMHVDGFRFDLASVLSRDTSGSAPRDYPKTREILWAIESDPVLAGTKLIAEAWDAAGLYQVGTFIGFADWFSEWNGPFRDDVRRFVRSDSGTVDKLAQRILASPDIYPRRDIDVNRSINFVTCHDGFTLNDLVSYNEKHNEANGENNRDGSDYNFSWNCGQEGETDDPQIQALRLRQIKNLLTILFISQGTPMLLMGDEVRRSQKGNNNAYCQDNELSWFDWSAVAKETDLLRYVKGLIKLVQSFKIFQEERLLEVASETHKPHLVWHGVKLEQPDWGYDSHSLAFTLRHPAADERLHVMLNAYWEPLTFELPLLGYCDGWHRIIDTSLASPDDFCDPKTAPPVRGEQYQVMARSTVILTVKPIDSCDLV